jgi:hypothetical protein
MAEPTRTLSSSSRVLASDAEREAVVARLHRAVGEGRLTADEAGDRIAAIYGARWRTELHAPVADLPETDSSMAGPLSWAELWTHLLWRARLVLDETKTGSPTARQRRQAAAALLAATAVLWTAFWMLLGATAG